MDIFKLILRDPTVSERRFERNVFREQVLFAEWPDGERRKVVYTIPDRGEPLVPGEYVPAPQSFTTDRYGRLSLARLVLVPLRASADVAPIARKQTA